MKILLKNALYLAALLAAHPAVAADPPAQPADSWVAPAIANYGKVRPYPDAAGQLNPEQTYKVIFNISKAPKQHQRVVPGLERVARFINLAELAKVPAKNLRVVAVIQGPATRSVLTQQAHRAKLNQANPDLELINALEEAGVEIMVCGQALAHHGFNPDEVSRDVTIAVAALTVLAEYQLDGYAVIAD